MIFGVLNPEKIWYHQLVHLPTSPEYCSLFTFGNPKKVIFQQYYSYILQIIYVISEENKQAHVNIVHRIVSYRTQGRLKWYRSIGHVRLPISLLIVIMSLYCAVSETKRDVGRTSPVVSAARAVFGTPSAWGW